MTNIWIALIIVAVGIGILLISRHQKTDEVSVSLSLDCTGSKSRHAKDNIRVDVRLQIVADLAECADPHIRSPGMRDSLDDFFRSKTEEALAIALKSHSSDDALANQGGLLERLEAAYGKDPYGAQVSWQIEHIDLTPISFYDSAHILDSSGIKILTERQGKAEREANEIRRKREIEEAKRQHERIHQSSSS